MLGDRPQRTKRPAKARPWRGHQSVRETDDRREDRCSVPGERTPCTCHWATGRWYASAATSRRRAGSQPGRPRLAARRLLQAAGSRLRAFYSARSLPCLQRPLRGSSCRAASRTTPIRSGPAEARGWLASTRRRPARASSRPLRQRAVHLPASSAVAVEGVEDDERARAHRRGVPPSYEDAGELARLGRRALVAVRSGAAAVAA